MELAKHESLAREYESEILVTFENEVFANMALRVLEVDDELQPNRIEKFLSQEGSKLKM